MKRAPIYQWLILGGGCLWLVLHHWLGYTGHNGFDDMLYAKLAQGWLEGHFDWQDHFSYRWGVLVPTALSYGLLGVKDFSTILPTLLATALTLGLIWKTMTKLGWLPLLVGFSLFAFERWTLAYSQQLMPDAILTLSIMWAWYVYAHYFYSERQMNAFSSGLLFSAALAMGFLTKGSIVLITPVLLACFAYDLWVRKAYRFWGAAILSGGIILALYFICIWILTGNPLGRLAAISANAYQNACSYHLQPTSVLWRRIAYDWWLDMLRQGTLLAPLLAVAAWPSRGSSSDAHRFWWLSSLGLLLCCNFMSISLEHYQPLCLDVRHYLFLVPISAIAVGYALADIPGRASSLLRMAVAVGFAFGVSTFLAYPVGDLLYLPLFIIMLLGWAITRWGSQLAKAWAKNLSRLALVLGLTGLILWPIQGIKEARMMDFKGRRAVFYRFLEQKDPKLPTLTDRIWMNLGPYYQQERGMRGSSYLNFTKPTALDFQGPYYLLLDGHSQYKTGVGYDDWPYWAQVHPTGVDTISAPNDPIQVYRFPGPPILAEPFVTIVWPDTFFTEEFGPTRVLKLDSLLSGSTELPQLLRLEAQAWQEAQVPLYLVATIEDSLHQTIKWHGKRFDQQIRALTTWWEVRLDLPLDQAALSQGRYLKVYWWNPEQKRTGFKELRLPLGLLSLPQGGD